MMQIFSLPFAMICVIGTVLTSVFFAWGGFAPALLYLGASAASCAAFYGAGMGAGALLLAGVPSGILIYMTYKRFPFFTRLNAAVISQLAVMFLLIVAMYIGLGQSIVEALTSRVTAWVENMDPALNRLMLRQFAMTGAGVYMTQETAMQILAGEMSDADTLAALKGIFEITGEALRLGLPAMLISSGIVTGVLAAGFSGRICARRGDDIDYQPVRKWFLPHQVTVGVLVILLTAFVLSAAKVNGAEALMAAALTAGETIATVAGAACISRMLSERGVTPGFRVALIVGLVLLLGRAVAIAGIVSALFGRRGLITGRMKNTNRQNDEEDDDK